MIVDSFLIGMYAFLVLLPAFWFGVALIGFIYPNIFANLFIRPPFFKKYYGALWKMCGFDIKNEKTVLRLSKMISFLCALIGVLTLFATKPFWLLLMNSKNGK